MKPVTITLQGTPQGKGRARAFVRGGHVGHFTPDKTRTYEGMNALTPRWLILAIPAILIGISVLIVLL